MRESHLRMDACPMCVSSLDETRRSLRRTHHEPIRDPTPLGRPVLGAERRIRDFFPGALHRGLTPDVDNGLDVSPVIHPTHKVPHSVVFPCGVLVLVRRKCGEEVRVCVDDRGGGGVGVGVGGENEVGFVWDGGFFVLVFGHVGALEGDGALEGAEGTCNGTPRVRD